MKKLNGIELIPAFWFNVGIVVISIGLMMIIIPSKKFMKLDSEEALPTTM